jgi:hypothetical protein
LPRTALCPLAAESVSSNVAVSIGTRCAVTSVGGGPGQL